MIQNVSSTLGTRFKLNTKTQHITIHCHSRRMFKLSGMCHYVKQSNDSNLCTFTMSYYRVSIEINYATTMIKYKKQPDAAKIWKENSTHYLCNVWYQKEGKKGNLKNNPRIKFHTKMIKVKYYEKNITCKKKNGSSAKILGDKRITLLIIMLHNSLMTKGKNFPYWYEFPSSSAIHTKPHTWK